MNNPSRCLPQSLLIALFLLFCFHLDVFAQQAEVGWNPDTGQVSGYKVYYGQSSGKYTSSADAGNQTTYTLQSLTNPAYFVAVTAYDSNKNESAYSPELAIYSMSASAGTGGSISPTGTLFQSQGANQTFTIAPASGYSVANVTVDGTSVGAVTSYTFSNIAAGHSIAATFSAQTTTAYTITATAGSNGSISPTGSVTVNSGASQSFTITPASGYSVSNVTVDGASAGAVTTYAFSNVSANHTISATFAQSTYSITATAGSNGSISPTGSVMVNSGANQSFTITPASGYSVSNVTVDGASAGAVTTYAFSNVSANHTISATFAQNTYSITATAGSNGSISPTGAVTVNSGASQSFTITPASGYSVSNVTVDGASAGAVTTYAFSNVSANHTISATFAKSTYSITATAGSNGSISPTGSVMVNSGASQSFTITPASGYSVSNVTVDGASAGAVTTYAFSNVSANHTISATFAKSTYSITAAAGSNGSISPTGSVTVNSGASQSFTITPASGYSVSNVTVDGASAGAVTTYAFSNVSANHTISATFAQNTYSITATAGSNGSISPSGTVNVTSGASKRFTISPATHYRISNVSVDGKPVGAVSSYTFTKVAASHTIAATFTLTGNVRIQALAQGGGSISPSGAVSVPAGTSRSFTITPAAGHQLTSVLVDGGQISALSKGEPPTGGGLTRASATYTFTDVAASHSIEAIFSKIPPPVADAGPDQIVKTGSTVTLNGSNSTDTVVGIASYKWTQVSGPKVSLLNPTEAVCTFTAPNVASGKSLGFKLVVTNSGGVTQSDSCLVNVSASDDAPLANAGPGQTVHPFTIVTLNGSGSFDPDGKIASYKWVQISGPKVQILNAKTNSASFVAPNPGALGSSLVFQLQVTDQLGLTTRDRCTVNVVNADPPPVADAGPNQNAVQASAVALDGSGSLDPGGSTVTYRWKQIRGVPVTLSDPSAATPAFIAPSDTGSDSADLLFMLTVTDANSLLSATAECAVTVSN